MENMRHFGTISMKFNIYYYDYNNHLNHSLIGHPIIIKQIIKKPYLSCFEKCTKDLIFASFLNLKPKPQFTDIWTDSLNCFNTGHVPCSLLEKSILWLMMEKFTFAWKEETLEWNKQWLHCWKWQFLLAYMVHKWLRWSIKLVNVNFLFCLFFFWCIIMLLSI